MARESMAAGRFPSPCLFPRWQGSPRGIGQKEGTLPLLFLSLAEPRCSRQKWLWSSLCPQDSLRGKSSQGGRREGVRGDVSMSMEEKGGRILTCFRDLKNCSCLLTSLCGQLKGVCVLTTAPALKQAEFSNHPACARATLQTSAGTDRSARNHNSSHHLVMDGAVEVPKVDSARPMKFPFCQYSLFHLGRVVSLHQYKGSTALSTIQVLCGRQTLEKSSYCGHSLVCIQSKSELSTLRGRILTFLISFPMSQGL